MNKPEFYKLVAVRGVIFDKRGEEVDIVSRGLCGRCECTQKGHEWIILGGSEEGKEYLLCRECHEISHL